MSGAHRQWPHPVPAPGDGDRQADHSDVGIHRARDADRRPGAPT